MKNQSYNNFDYVVVKN